MLTQEEIEAIRKRAEKAKAGNPMTDMNVLYRLYESAEDIPKLLAEIDRLRASVEKAKQIVGNLTHENAILKGEKPITVHLNGGDDE